MRGQALTGVAETSLHTKGRINRWMEWLRERRCFLIIGVPTLLLEGKENLKWKGVVAGHFRPSGRRKTMLVEKWRRAFLRRNTEGFGLSVERVVWFKAALLQIKVEVSRKNKDIFISGRETDERTRGHQLSYFHFFKLEAAACSRRDRRWIWGWKIEVGKVILLLAKRAAADKISQSQFLTYCTCYQTIRMLSALPS